MRRTLVVLFTIALMAAVAAPAMAAKPAPETVTVVGFFEVGEPLTDALEEELAAFANENRVEVIYEAADPDSYLDLVTGPNPPDVILSPNIFTLAPLASELVDLGEFVNPTILRRDFGDHLIDLATVDGAILGAPTDLNVKSLVWYKPAAFAAQGYAIPQTFDELVALSDTMVANGHTPWCNYIESGFATGWMGTDWVEDLLLSAEGPTVYDEWVDHTVPFTDGRVETAFEQFQQMIDTPGYVFDRANMLTSLAPFNSFLLNAPSLDAGDCLMHKQGAFFGDFVGAFGGDIDEFSVFKFPSVNPEFGDAATGGAGTFVSALNQRKEVRQLTRFMLSQKFGREALAESGTGWVLANVRFDNSRYTDELTRSFADIGQAAVRAGQFRFDGADLMPEEVGQGTFWAGIVDLVAGTKTVSQVLTAIDASWPN